LKSLTLLWQQVLEELGTVCSVSTSKDMETCLARFEHEGVSFLTITLPTFGKDFQKSLAEGFVDRCLFTGFRWRGGLPLFLGGFLDRVFDRGTGRLLDDPDVDSIFAVRQLTLMFAKILLPCSESRVAGAIEGYIECEKELRDSDRNTSTEQYDSFHRMSHLIFREVFSRLDSDVFASDILPKHGPGSTADRLSGNGKYDQYVWPRRLERVFPFGEHAIPSWRYKYLLDQAQLLEPGTELPVRVITVPKTLKTPRIIAIEPTAMQYMQQGLMEKFVDYLETDSTVSGMIGFSQQEPNQLLAKEGSITGQLATLDLSEASDRVSNQLVRTLFRPFAGRGGFPHLGEAVDATRTRKADVPGHGVIRLAKFASMGSALTFPIEAVVFLTIVFLGIEKGHRRLFTRGDIKSFAGQVRVYGDDIIVPVDYAQLVRSELEAFGFRVNADKSFWNGKFRESCGKDYYDGHDVTPIRVRRVFPTERADVEEIVSLVSLRNQMYFAGLWGTARWLDDRVSKILPKYPVVMPSSPVLGRHSFLGYQAQKVCPDHHAPLVKGYVVTAKPPPSKATGEGALLKWFLKRGDEPFADRDHLQRQGRPDAVTLKLRWAPPF